MARRKTLPESVRAKLALAERLAQLRSELYGDRGGPEMARRLGIPVRTWYNYEGGVTVPAEVILKIIELTSVEAVWLLHGEGPKFRSARSERVPAGGTPSVTIGALLRTALQLLEEKNERIRPPSAEGSPEVPIALNRLAAEPDLSAPNADHRVFRELAGATSPDGTTVSQIDGNARVTDSRREWLAAQRENRCVCVSGDAMAPIIADGASVAYAKEEEDVQQLDGKLVVAWLDNQPVVVRWFEQCGRYALLRAQNPRTVPQQVLVDLEDSAHKRFRRVLWVNTPH